MKNGRLRSEETAHKSLNGPMSGGRAWVLLLSSRHPELGSIFKRRENIPGTRMVLSVSCVRTYIYYRKSCHAPVESNFHTVHMSHLTLVSQLCLVNIWGRVLCLPVTNGKEGFVVEVD